MWGRRLSYVMMGDRNINAQMIRDGYASYYVKYGPPTDEAGFLEAAGQMSKH